MDQQSASRCLTQKPGDYEASPYKAFKIQKPKFPFIMISSCKSVFQRMETSTAKQGLGICASWSTINSESDLALSLPISGPQFPQWASRNALTFQCGKLQIPWFWSLVQKDTGSYDFSSPWDKWNLTGTTKESGGQKQDDQIRPQSARLHWLCGDREPSGVMSAQEENGNYSTLSSLLHSIFNLLGNRNSFPFQDEDKRWFHLL